MNRIRELPWPILAVAGVLIVAIGAGIAWYVIRKAAGREVVWRMPGFGAGWRLCEPYRRLGFG
jgi:hypothetical protein